MRRIAQSHSPNMRSSPLIIIISVVPQERTEATSTRVQPDDSLNAVATWRGSLLNQVDIRISHGKRAAGQVVCECVNSIEELTAKHRYFVEEERQATTITRGIEAVHMRFEEDEDSNMKELDNWWSYKCSHGEVSPVAGCSTDCMAPQLGIFVKCFRRFDV